MQNNKEIENSQRQSYANLTNESVTDSEDNSNNFYKINAYSSSFDTKIKGLSSVSSVTRDRFIDFEEMSVGEAMPSGKREGQQQSTPKYRNNSYTNNSNNGGSKVSLISSKKSEVSGSDEDTKIFIKQLKILQNKVNQQENQMKNMDQKCEEVKKENSKLKKNLDKIAKENEEKKLAEKDQEISKLQTKNSALQEQLEKVKENYENRISEYQNLIDDLNSQLLDKENQVEDAKRQLMSIQKKMNQTKEQNQQLVEKIKNLEDLIEKQVEDSNIIDENSNSRIANNLNSQSSMNYQSTSDQYSSEKRVQKTSSIIPKKQKQQKYQQNQLTSSSNDRSISNQRTQLYQSQQLSQEIYQQLSSTKNAKQDDQQATFQQQIQINQQILQNQGNSQQQQLVSQQQSQNFDETQFLQSTLKSIVNKQTEKLSGEKDSKHIGRFQKERSRSQQSSRCRSPWGETLTFEVLSNNNYSQFQQTKHELDNEDECNIENKFISSSTQKSIPQIANGCQKNMHNMSLKFEETDSSLCNFSNKMHQQSLTSNNQGSSGSSLNNSKFRKNSRNSKMMAMLVTNQQQNSHQKQQINNKSQKLNQTIDKIRCKSEQRNITSPISYNTTLQPTHQNQISSPISGKLSNKNNKKGNSIMTEDFKQTKTNQTIDNSFINENTQNNSFNSINYSQNNPNGFNNFYINNTTNNTRNLMNKPPSRSRSRQEELSQKIQYQNNNQPLQTCYPVYSNSNCMSNSSSSKNKYQKSQDFFIKDLNNQQCIKRKNCRIKNESPTPLSQKQNEFHSIDYEQISQHISRKQALSAQSNYSNLQKGLSNHSKSPQNSQPHSTTNKKIYTQPKNQKINLTLNSNYLSSNAQTPNNANTSTNSTKSKKGQVKAQVQKYQSLNADDYTNSESSINQKPKYQTITPSSQSSNGCSTSHTNASNHIQQQLIQQQGNNQYIKSNYFSSVESKIYPNNSNTSINENQKMNQIYHNQRIQNNKSPLQKRIKSSNSPQIQFYDGSKQNIMNKTMNYVDVTNYLENHGLQQSAIEENQFLGIQSVKNQNMMYNITNTNNAVNPNAFRQSEQMQNIQNLTNLNSAHLRSRSEQAQYNQKKQQQLLQQQLNDQINQNNKKQQLSILFNDETQNRIPSKCENQSSKNKGICNVNSTTNKYSTKINTQQQNLNINLGINNYEILEQTIESQTSSSIKSRQKNK